MGRVAGTLDPGAVDFIYGPVKLKGFAKGSMIKIAQTEDSFNLIVGTDGEAARSLNYNDVTIVTASLLQTALANGALSGLHSLDKLSGGGAIQPLLIRDRSSAGQMFACSSAWIVKPADQDWDAQATNRDWSFACFGMPPTNLIAGS